MQTWCVTSIPRFPPKLCVPAILPLILHSRNDEVIPFADSEELVASSGLPPETLIEIGSDHRLADESSLSVMLWVCNLFVSGKKFPGMEGEHRITSVFRKHGGSMTGVYSTAQD